MGIDTLPFVIGWELTLACNLRCTHCGSVAGLVRRNELTTDEALKVCDQFPELLVQEVDFTGGEPLFRTDWEIIASRIAKLGIHLQMITNGVLMNPDMAARIANAGINGLGFSLDGMEKTHDTIRCFPGLFRRVINGIEQAIKAGLDIAVLTTVNAQNLNELPEILSLLCSVGVHRWQLQPLFPLGRAKNNHQLMLSQEQFMQIGAFLESYGMLAEKDGFTIEMADSLGYGTHCDVRPGVWPGCPAGIVGCGITSDGKIKGCLSMPDELIEGDLRENDLWSIWFHPNSFVYNRRFSVDDLGPACRGCDRGTVCKGGCSSMS